VHQCPSEAVYRREGKHLQGVGGVTAPCSENPPLQDKPILPFLILDQCFLAQRCDQPKPPKAQRFPRAILATDTPSNGIVSGGAALLVLSLPSGTADSNRGKGRGWHRVISGPSFSRAPCGSDNASLPYSADSAGITVWHVCRHAARLDSLAFPARDRYNLVL
jgi:hypothetical protein